MYVFEIHIIDFQKLVRLNCPFQNLRRSTLKLEKYNLNSSFLNFNISNCSTELYKFCKLIIYTTHKNPDESFRLKFIPNQSEIFQIIPEFVSAPKSFIPI